MDNGRIRIDDEEIVRRIDSFPQWNYEFDLRGHKTPPLAPRRANRHAQREHYFFAPLLDLCGGTLAGKRVLDLGCNAGFWSLKAVEHGCDFVLGIDGRSMHIDQANFVFEARGIDEARYRFQRGNVFDLDVEHVGHFDIVLCLGLLYHVSRHVELLQTISAVNDDILVIDSDVSIAPGSYLRVRQEDPSKPLHATDRSLVMSPTKRAIVDLVTTFGYEVAILKPCFDEYAGARRYRQGRRKAFLCARRTPLDRLQARREPLRATLTPREYFWFVADNWGALARLRRSRG